MIIDCYNFGFYNFDKIIHHSFFSRSYYNVKDIKEFNVLNMSQTNH